MDIVSKRGGGWRLLVGLPADTKIGIFKNNKIIKTFLNSPA